MKAQDTIFAFNRGVVSRLALARLDLAKLKMSGEEQTNWMPRALGSMMLRPGLGYLGSVAGKSRMLPFIFSVDDTANIEMSAGLMRVWVNDALVTRPAVSAAIANGGFASNLSGWTDFDETGATSAWETGGFMGLTGDGENSAIREQAVSIGAPGPHALRIVVRRGPVTLRIGSMSLGSQYRRDTKLGTGTHSIVVDATGTFYVQFRSLAQRLVLIDSIGIEAAGVLTLPTPYAESDLPLLRKFQSGDVVYLACDGKQQRKIERRDDGSWSVVLYEPDDGPYRIQNVTPTTITPSGLVGNITLTASSDEFDDGHVGALFALTSSSQRVEASLSGADQFSEPIRVAGIGVARFFTEAVLGTWVGKLTLQRSIGEIGAWQLADDFDTNITATFKDGLDNQIIFYRIGFKAGDYTSGTAEITLDYASGNRTGVVRVTSVADPTLASAEVVSRLFGTEPTSNWSEGLWSDFRGWPSSVTIHDFRLWWAGKDRFIGSVSDAFESFDPNFVGDAGPISRSIGFGPVDSINWLLSLDRLTAGTDGAELSCRSSALDEPLTPTNFTPKKAGTQGTARIQAVEVDGKGLFVQRCGYRLYELAFGDAGRDYSESDLTALCPDVCAPGVAMVEVQRQPDTRIHCVLTDGTVAVLVFDKTENLICWVKVETDGVVEDVSVLPGIEEDAIYYVVRRVVNGATVRYLERWALEREARGASVSKLADSFVMGSGSVISVPHLEGKTVVAWGDSLDLGEFVVIGGVVTLPIARASVCIGLPYEARFKSTKLAYLIEQGLSGLTARKRIGMLGVVLADTHAQGLQYGQSFDRMDDLPLIEEGALINPNAVNDAYEQPPFTFPGDWATDSRLCLRASAPRPCTVLAAVIDMTTNART